MKKLIENRRYSSFFTPRKLEHVPSSFEALSKLRA